MIAFAAALIPPWARWAALAAAVLAVFIAGERFGAGRVQAKNDARELAQAKENMRVQELRDARHRSIEDAKDRDLRDISTRLADALERLRNRPERLPEAERPFCAGSTGRELSGPDAAFLERLAARADTLRAELGACYERERANAMTGATP